MSNRAIYCDAFFANLTEAMDTCIDRFELDPDHNVLAIIASLFGFILSDDPEAFNGPYLNYSLMGWTYFLGGLDE